MEFVLMQLFKTQGIIVVQMGAQEINVTKPHPSNNALTKVVNGAHQHAVRVEQHAVVQVIAGQIVIKNIFKVGQRCKYLFEQHYHCHLYHTMSQ